MRFKADEALNSASHVEIAFRDVYLARGDMWRFVIPELGGKATYKGQTLLFMGTIKGVVKNIYLRSKSVRSAYFSPSTKPVFRSESARYVLFIQMSKEMWDFDVEGSGEIMFNKVINGFLPDLFKRWVKINARHLVSIVLFTRLEYDGNLSNSGDHLRGVKSALSAHQFKREVRDYYRVVVSEMASGEWVKILYQLKREFRIFLRDVSVIKTPKGGTTVFSPVEGRETQESEYVIAGRPSTSPRSNILEAINLAASQFAQDYIDRDLVRTGVSVVVITPGTGVYEVDYNMLRLTTDTLVNNGIGIDLVCLSRMPLHSVPLFKYRNPQSIISHGTESITNGTHDDVTPRQRQVNFGSLSSRPRPISQSIPPEQNGTPRPHSDRPTTNMDGEWTFAMPHWIDISFWIGHSEETPATSRNSSSRTSLTDRRRYCSGTFVLRCRMYELQMMGVMQNEMSDISISYLHNDIFHPALSTGDRDSTGANGDFESPSLEKRSSYVGSLKRRWEGGRFPTSTGTEFIEDHDENVFQPVDRILSSHREARNSRRKRQLQVPDRSRGEGSAIYGTSFSDLNRSPSSYENEHGSGYFDRKMEERSRERDRLPWRYGSTSSLISKADNPSEKLPRASRHISFGTRGFFYQKPVASTGISENIQAAPALTRGFHAEPILDQKNFAVSHQIRNSLTRTPSQQSAISPVLFVNDNQKPDRPSQPIAIKSSSRVVATAGAATPDRGRSYEEHDISNNHPAKKDVLQLASISKQAGVKIQPPSSGLGPDFPKTPPQPNSLFPWLTLLNPSNPKKNSVDVASHFRRWQHVFPRPVRTSTIKWKSLCSPAAVPLTNEYFPTTAQLAAEYQESPYKIARNEEDELSDALKSREVLVRELISFRLSHGFQIVVGKAVSELTSNVPNIFHQNYMSQDGAMVFMSAGNSIHQLQCIAGGEVEVKRYSRKPSTANESPTEGDSLVVYQPLIRTLLAKEYEPRDIIFHPPVDEYNWNYIDNFLAGYEDDFSDSLRFWRARFVLIPVEQSNAGRRHLSLVTEDSEEEIRLEGIRQLTQLWQRNRYTSPEDRQAQGIKKNRKDTNPLAIEYQTRDSSAIVAATVAFGVDNSPLIEGDAGGPFATVLEDEPHHSQHYDLQKVAQDLQGDRGIRMLDRRWHLRLHYNCFVGSDLTSWLLKNFTDIETRHQAVELGNRLMEEGLFHHVAKKHQFRDGNFFYQLASDHRALRPESRAGWFGTRKVTQPVPVTPAPDLQRVTPAAPVTSATRSRSNTETSRDSGQITPTPKAIKKARFSLSRVMKYDVDPRKKSYRQETVNLHYDRLHNPDNCYHIRIDWMNVTAKLIEDAIVNWATLAEKYGLKLVEVPIGEASKISESNPFRSPYLVELAASPPESPIPSYFDQALLGQVQTDNFPYHKALLRKLGFVLDLESASSFPPEVDVTYSWGRPSYQFTQYIHKSGLLLAQIADDGKLLLLANRLCQNRAAATRDPGRFGKSDMDDRRNFSGNQAPQPNPLGPDRVSPTASPLVRAVPDFSLSAFSYHDAERSSVTSESIKDEVEAFCHDAEALRTFFEAVSKANMVSSPVPTPMAETNASPFGLPSLDIAIRASSPALRQDSGPSLSGGASADESDEALGG